MRCFAVLGLALLLPLLPAQSLQYTSKVSVPDDLVARQALAEGQTALEQGDLQRAFERWQTVLDRFGTKVLQIKTAPRTPGVTDEVIPGDLFRGLRSVVIAQIRGAGAAAYEAAVQRRAEEELARAMADGDEARLRSVHERFPLTRAARRAALLQVDLLLEGGRTEEALTFARSFLGQWTEEGAPAEDLARLAARVAHAAVSQGKIEVLNDIKALPAAATALQFGDERLSVQAYVDRALAEVRPPAPVQNLRPAMTVLESDDWSFALARNTNETTGLSIGFGTARDLEREEDTLYAVVPTIQDGIVYWCDGLSVRAHSLTSGEAVWSPVRANVGGFAGRRNANLQHRVVLAGDLLFASLEDVPLQREQTSWQGFRPIEAIPSRKLIAIEAATGAVRWSHAAFGTDDLATRTFLARFHVNQPPLVIGNTLFVAGTYPEGIFHQWVVACDATTGAILWRTYLGSGQQELNMFGRPIKEAIPSPVIEDRGRLFVSTNIGTLASLDAATGSIHWISAYEQEPIPTTERPETRERAPGFLPSAPVVFGDQIFFAPSDAYEVLAADRETGAITPVESSRRERHAPWRYFLGLHDGHLIIAGANVQSIDAATLRTKWRSLDMTAGSRGLEGRVLGQPVIDANGLVFTTRSPSQRESTFAFRIDLATGRVVEQRALTGRDREGNLVASPDGWVLATTSRLFAFVDHAELARRLEALSTAGTADPALLMRLGDIQAHQRRLGAALKTFERALAGADAEGPRGFGLARRARLALFNGWLRAAREPEVDRSGGLPTSIEERFTRALSYAQSEAQRMEATYGSFLAALAAGGMELALRRAEELLALGDAAWLELGPDLASRHPDLSPETRAPVGVLALLHLARIAESANQPKDAVRHYHRIQLEHPRIALGKRTGAGFASERIIALIAEHGRAVYEALDRAAENELKTASAAKDLDALRAVVDRYPESAVIDRAYGELAELLAARNEPALAHWELQRLLTRRPDRPLDVLYRAARYAQAAKAFDSSAELLNLLERERKDAVIDTPQGRQSVRDAASALRAERPASPPTNRPLTRRLQPGPEVGEPAEGDRFRILTPKGSAPAAARGLLFLHSGTELRAADPLTGTTLWGKSALVPPEVLLWRDGRLLASVDETLIAVDPLTGREAWRFTEPAALRAACAFAGRVHLAYASVQTRPVTILITLDAITGREITRTTLLSRGDIAELHVGASTILLSMPGEAHAFDALTGASLEKFATDRGAPNAQLGPDDAVILAQGPGAIGAVARPLRVTARDARTGNERWTWADLPPGISRALPVGPRTLVLTHQEGPKPAQLIVLDLGTGKPKLARTLDAQAIPLAAVEDGDRLYLTIRSRVGDGSRSAQRIDAIDLRRAERVWSTSEFGDSVLEIAPTDDWLVVLKSPRQTGPTFPADQRAEIYLIDGTTGRAEELIDLGPVDLWASDGGLTSFPGGFAASTGALVRTWIPKAE